MGIYRPPSSSFETVRGMISSELDKIATPNNPVVMRGDINLDGLVESEKKRNLDKMLKSHGIYRLNKTNKPQPNLH